MGLEYIPSFTSVLLLETEVQKGIRTMNGFPSYCVRCHIEKSAFKLEFYTKQETIINVTHIPYHNQSEPFDSTIPSVVETIPSFIKKSITLRCPAGSPLAIQARLMGDL